jgi:K+-sensing histidine kinase KdpD
MRLETILFGHRFNQSIMSANLPEELQTIEFGAEFNHGILNVNLPNNLKSIIFGYFFNQPIISANLPDSINSITFGYHFNQSIILANLPCNLYYIYDYSNRIEYHESLPKTLYSITFIHNKNRIVKYKRQVGKYTKSAIIHNS